MRTKALIVHLLYKKDLATGLASTCEALSKGSSPHAYKLVVTVLKASGWKHLKRLHSELRLSASKDSLVNCFVSILSHMPFCIRCPVHKL